MVDKQKRQEILFEHIEKYVRYNQDNIKCCGLGCIFYHQHYKNCDLFGHITAGLRDKRCVTIFRE